MKIARGTWQERIWKDLVTGFEITNPVSNLRGNARNYSSKYAESFGNLLHRAKLAGYKIQRTPGIRGGEYSATYQIIAYPIQSAA